MSLDASPVVAVASTGTPSGSSAEQIPLDKLQKLCQVVVVHPYHRRPETHPASKQPASQSTPLNHRSETRCFGTVVANLFRHLDRA